MIANRLIGYLPPRATQRGYVVNARRWLIWCIAFVAALVGSTASTIGQTIYEAENATLSGPSIASANGGYSGTGYADYNNNTSDYVEFTLVSNSGGGLSHSLSLRQRRLRRPAVAIER
jgi:hypothetical protein